MKDTGWIMPRSAGGARNKSKKPLLITRVKSGRGDGVFFANFRLSTPMMQKMRWIGGDKVVIKVEDGCVFIKRNVRGFSLSPCGASAEERAKGVGEMAAATAKITSDIITGSKEYSFEDMVIDDGIIMVTAPKAEKDGSEESQGALL